MMKKSPSKPSIFNPKCNGIVVVVVFYFVSSYLFAEHGDVFVEGFRRADIATLNARLTGRTSGQFALFKDQGQ